MRLLLEEYLLDKELFNGQIIIYCTNFTLLSDLELTTEELPVEIFKKRAQINELKLKKRQKTLSKKQAELDLLSIQ